MNETNEKQELVQTELILTNVATEMINDGYDASSVAAALVRVAARLMGMAEGSNTEVFGAAARRAYHAVNHPNEADKTVN